MVQQKTKKKNLGNSDDTADQIAGQNDDNTLGIIRANLELKHMFIICSLWSFLHNLFQFGAIIKPLNEIGLATFITKRICRFLYFQKISTCLSPPTEKYLFKVQSRSTVLIY